MPGARRCSCTGVTCRSSRAAGRRRCRHAPAKPRSCRVFWARITTTRFCSTLLAHARLEPSDLAELVDRCRACQADLRAQAKPRGDRLFAERAGDLKKRIALYWASAGHLAALPPAKEQQPAKSQGARRPGSGKKARSPASPPTAQEGKSRRRWVSAHPSPAKTAARPSEAMNQGCHRLKLEPPIRAQATKVA